MDITVQASYVDSAQNFNVLQKKSIRKACIHCHEKARKSFASQVILNSSKMTSRETHYYVSFWSNYYLLLFEKTFMPDLF